MTCSEETLLERHKRRGDKNECSLAQSNGYNVLTITLYGNVEVLQKRYLNKMTNENRQSVHLSTTIDKFDDVEFAITLLGTASKKVLEIACGSGRFLILMAKAGHDITGLDFDEYMLGKIADKVTIEKIIWHKADVICDDRGTDFDVVILGANFLYNIVSDMNYEQSQELMIQKSANALAVGGHIFIDCGYTQYPEKWFNNPNANVVWEGIDSHGNFGKMILLDSVYDKESRINKFILRFELLLADGSALVQEIPSEKHFATLEQLHKWLAESGFVIEQECSDYVGNPISETTHRAIIGAKKVSESK